MRSAGQTRLQRKRICIPHTSISEYNNTFRASWCVQSAHGVCVLQNTLVFLCVCGHQNEQFERNRAVYELYLLCTSQKSKNITYLTNESVRQGAKKSRLLKFSALLKLLFNIVDPYQKNDYYQSRRKVILADLWLCLLVLAVNWNNY